MSQRREEGGDVWRELTAGALQLIRAARHAQRSVREIVDATLDRFRQQPDVEKHRARLEGFVRDMLGGDDHT